MSYLPIEDHGIIGNLHTAALVGTDGTIDWLCVPAFDSPSVFCSILDEEKGGHFALRPVEYTRSQQIYLPDTNVLLTRFFSPGGLAETLDFMPIVTGPKERHRLVRNVRVIRGRMDFRMECLPAFDFARRDHSVSVGKSGAVFSSGEGCLGLEPFRRLLNDRRFAKLPMLLETPKLDTPESRRRSDVDTLDARNLRTLRRLMRKV